MVCKSEPHGNLVWIATFAVVTNFQQERVAVGSGRERDGHVDVLSLRMAGDVV